MGYKILMVDDDKERIYEKISGYDAEGDSRVVTEFYMQALCVIWQKKHRRKSGFAKYLMRGKQEKQSVPIALHQNNMPRADCS